MIQVEITDKLTKKTTTIEVTGITDPAAAVAHVEKLTPGHTAKLKATESTTEKAK